ncbi:MAG: S9 family peptidase [Acidobacteriota bacterium]
MSLFLIASMTVCAQKKPVTIEALKEIAALPADIAPGNPLDWSSDGTQFVAKQGSKLVIYDCTRQALRVLIDTNSINTKTEQSERGPFDWENRRVSETTAQWSPLGDQILYLSGGELYLIRVDSGSPSHVPSRGHAHDAKFSPDGKTIAFRSDWDLYTVEITAPNKQRRLTRGGTDLQRNAGLDWVYPEELDLGTAYWWSPDSKSIAYLQFNVSGEPLYPHADLRGPRAIDEPQRYPQAGERNPEVKLGVVTADGGSTKWFDVGNTVFEFLIARVTWSPDAKSLYVVRPNRTQNKLALLAFDAATRKAATVLEETAPDWVNVNGEPVFIKDGAEFLWLSERDGFRHIYRYARDGKMLAQLTSGAWEVASIDGVDETTGLVYYTSSEPSPLEHHAYTIAFDGSGKRPLTAGAGWHTAIVGPKARYYLHGYASSSSPQKTTVHVGDGREIATYRESDRRVADTYAILPTELSSYQSNGVTFYSRLIRPAGFDAAKKYPAVVLVYGGPGAQGVRNTWLGADFDQVLAQAGFVVWQVDNRGSAGRGHAFEAPVFRNLGPTELADQVEGVRQLIAKGFVDPARVGVRGWSYGGFMTLNAMLNGGDTFRAGAAGAPVTDWSNYDTIYTERYMGLPEANADGYKNTACRNAPRISRARSSSCTTMRMTTYCSSTLFKCWTHWSVPASPTTCGSIRKRHTPSRDPKRST